MPDQSLPDGSHVVETSFFERQFTIYYCCVAKNLVHKLLDDRRHESALHLKYLFICELYTRGHAHLFSSGSVQVRFFAKAERNQPLFTVRQKSKFWPTCPVFEKNSCGVYKLKISKNAQQSFNVAARDIEHREEYTTCTHIRSVEIKSGCWDTDGANQHNNTQQ